MSLDGKARAVSRNTNVAAVLGFLGVAGCALIVGDPSGDFTPRGSAAEAGAHDAGAKDDGSPRDAQQERPSGAMSDSAVADRDTNDVAADVTPGDVVVDGGSGFCAHRQEPAGTFVVCDDFDENPDATLLGMPATAGTSSSLVVKGHVFVSPPHALYVQTNPGVAATATGWSYVARAIAPGQSVSVDLDLQVTNVPADASSEFVNLEFTSASGEKDALSVNLVGNGAGNVTAVQVFEVDPGDAGTRYHPSVQLSVTSWVHMTFVVSKDGTSVLDSLIIGGQPVETGVQLASGFVLGAAVARVGWSYAEGPGSRAAYIDNAVLTSRE